jgi:hypothetical protein
MTRRKRQLGIVVSVLAALGAFYVAQRGERQDAVAHTAAVQTGTDSGELRPREPPDAPRPVEQSPPGRISCGDLAGAAHGVAMKGLAVAANLPDAAYTQYHEAVASAMCDGDSKTVNDLVDSGYLSYGEAKAMQDVIASDRRVQLSTERTAEGRRFEEAWKGLRELGLCSACAADVAGFYAKQPASRCGVLAAKALDGDEPALEELESEPAFCQPK